LNLSKGCRHLNSMLRMENINFDERVSISFLYYF